MSALVYFHVAFPLWPGTGWSFEEEHFRDKHRPGSQFHRRWRSEGLLCPGISSGCSCCFCRQFVERLCSLLVLILGISRFSNLVDCEWSGWISFWLELILCGMMWYAFYWDIGMILAGSASLCQRHLPLNPVGFVLWKLGVGNWEFCLLCISQGLTDVSFDLLPCRFPFGQALAEALKTNTSVTSIDLGDNSIGDEGAQAFPGIPSGCSWCLCRQLERLCSLLMLILRISRFQILLTVSEVGEFLFDLNSFCVVWCGMLSTGILAWYWLEMYLSKRHLPWIQWDLFFGNSESETESSVSFVFHKVSRMSALIYFHVAFPLARH